MTTILNKHHYGGNVPPDAISIMRGTPFGNPFRFAPGKTTRDEAISFYREWLWRKLKSDAAFRGQVKSLHGKRLCCCCAPLPCHGDVLARAAAWLNED